MSVGNFQVIQPSGVLTGATSDELIQQFNRCLESTVKIVLIDLQNVDFIDSSGLGTLVSLHTKLRLAGGRLYLCAAKDQARTLFDVSDMDRIFEIFPNREAFYTSVIRRNQDVIAL
jgi:anti-sigma B factor antagonist